MKFIRLLLALLSTASISHAATITGADTSNQGATFTTADGLVTLAAYSSTAPLTVGALNTGTGFIGVSSLGGANGINDLDGLASTTNDQEALDIQLQPTVSLTSIVFAWSRADGTAATDGIRISGFTSDPGATMAQAYEDLRWDASTNSVYLELDGPLHFNSTQRTLAFSNSAASLGQILRITATDSDQVAPQAAIASINYVPEPSAALLGGLGLLGLLRRRR